MLFLYMWKLLSFIHKFTVSILTLAVAVCVVSWRLPLTLVMVDPEARCGLFSINLYITSNKNKSTHTSESFYERLFIHIYIYIWFLLSHCPYLKQQFTGCLLTHSFSLSFFLLFPYNALHSLQGVPGNLFSVCHHILTLPPRIIHLHSLSWSWTLC